VKIQHRQSLIVDADDTLWENNIYFERAFDDFCDFLAHSTVSAEQVRAVMRSESSTAKRMATEPRTSRET
jgi:phosphoglycolate phosphatase-like HAD superfamily hydrolase